MDIWKQNERKMEGATFMHLSFDALNHNLISHMTLNNLFIYIKKQQRY